MSQITVKLKEFSKVELIYDKNIRLYIPIKGSVNILVNSRSLSLKEADVFLLNSYQVGLFHPNFKEKENLFFELTLNSSILADDRYQDLNFNNLINSFDDSFILPHLDYLYQNKLSSFEEKELADKLVNHLSSFELSRSKDLLSKDEDKDLIGSYLDSLKASQQMIDINMDQLSKTYKISPSNFSKTFKRVTGFTLANFKQLYRLENASKLLEKTDRTLDEIAIQVGYHSSKSLYDAYKNNMNLLPSSYRKLAKESIEKKIHDLASTETYKEFKNRVNPISFQRVYEEYSEYNHYQLNVDHKLQKFSYQGISLYNLNTIGSDHLNNIAQINKDLNINYILLDLYLNEDLRDLVYLKSSNLYLTRIDILDLLELLNKENIQVGISIDMVDTSYLDYRSNHYKLIEDMQNFLLESIAYNYRKNYQWIIRLEEIKNLDLANDYLYRRKVLLQESFGLSLRLAVFLGDIRLERLDFLTKYIREDKRSKDIKKIYFNLVYDFDPSLLENQSPETIYNQLDYDFRSVIYQVNELKHYMDISVLHFLVETGKEDKALISDKLAIYNDLIMNYIYLTNLTYMEDELMYFIILDRANKASYRPNLMRDKHLKTPTYFLLDILSKIDGSLIQSPPGVLAIKDGLDIHIIVKNNLYLDYRYGEEKEFKDLDLAKRKISLDVYPLYGRYRINQYLINARWSNPLTSLADFNVKGLLTDDDRDYIAAVTQPHRRVDLLELSNSHTLEIEMDPFATSYIHLQKM